ncbi:MAG: YceD family protein [Chthoniobacterales bacterium]
MKIHLRQLTHGQAHIEEDLDPSLLELETGRATGPVHCSLDIGLSDGGLFATGTLSVPVELQCVKCLRLFETTLVVPDFATQAELEGRESVDLTPDIREDILLILPSHPRCDADGRTKCPATFQSAPAAPLTEEVDPSTWNALDQLKPKK